jgi:primosomal protein N' (replication factor Y)
MSAAFWRVAVEAPLPEPLTYRTPEHLAGNPLLRRGASVRVPLGRRQAIGVLLQPMDAADGDFKIKDITEIHEARPALPDRFLQWLEWLARYYMHPIGPVTECAFPPLKRAENARQKSRKGPVAPSLKQVAPPTLTDEQRTVIDDILASPGFQANLVHGVTGSGKTEVYIRLIEDLIARGKQALVLVPEIC